MPTFFSVANVELTLFPTLCVLRGNQKSEPGATRVLTSPRITERGGEKVTRQHLKLSSAGAPQKAKRTITTKTQTFTPRAITKSRDLHRHSVPVHCSALTVATGDSADAHRQASGWRVCTREQGHTARPAEGMRFRCTLQPNRLEDIMPSKRSHTKGRILDDFTCMKYLE